MADELFDVVPATPADSTPDNTRASVILRVHVQPGAGRAQVAGRHGDALHIRVAPPPQDGRANKAVIDLLAETLDLAASGFEVVSGEHSRDKRIKVADVDLEGFRKHLDLALSGATSPRRGGRSSR